MANVFADMLHGFENLPTGGKVAVVAGVAGAGVLGYVAFKKNGNSNTAASSGTTSGTTTNAGGLDNSTSDGNGAGTNPNPSPPIYPVPAQPAPNQYPVPAQPAPNPPVPIQGQPMLPPVPAQRTGGGHNTYGATARVWHPLQFAVLSSKRPFRGL